MSLVVNPDFLSLEPFLQSLPECFDREGMTVYKGRNEIKIFEREGLLLNVKSYRKPILLNRIAYTFFRKSKARRAYENALEVMARGFETPVPVAYLEQQSGGLLEKSWFVSLHCPYTRMLREFADNSDVSGREDILQALGAYVAGLHRSGILHLDLSIGNILFEKDETGIRFSLVDINRMRFCSIDQELGCRNFERLRGNADFFRVLAHSYAAARGFDPESCLKSILEHSARSVRHFDRKRAFKRFFRPGR
jgi:tRNA A-37 threonylcarbamoyl transferase component Bud32